MSGLAQRVYYGVPVPVQNALISAYAVLRRWKRYGGRSPRLLDEARRAASLDENAIKVLHFERVRAMLVYAGDRVPYYRRLFSRTDFRPREFRSLEDLRGVPVLTKAEARQNARELVADPPCAVWTNETSGSTGSPLTVQLSADAYQLSMALPVLHEETLGITPSDRRATFAGRLVQPVTRDVPPFWRFNHAEHQMLCSAYHLSDRNLPAYLDALERFQPAEIIGYPSAIATVALFCERTGRRPRLPLKAVVTNSETLLDWQREIISRALGAPVSDYYGTAEAVVFAGECAAGNYHPHPLMGYVEVLDVYGETAPPGVPGRLVCTTLCNRAMPLIRYEVGDLVIRLEGACPCGRTGNVWSAVLGRTDDVVTTPDGHLVGRLDHVFKGVTAIREAQIAQTAVDRLVIRVVPDVGYSEKVATILVANTRERVGSRMHIDVQPVSAIPRTSRGKFRGVVVERDPSVSSSAMVSPNSEGAGPSR